MQHRKKNGFTWQTRFISLVIKHFHLEVTADFMDFNGIDFYVKTFASRMAGPF